MKKLDHCIEEHVVANLGEVDAFRLNGSDCLCSAMQEGLRHSWFVSALRSPIESIVSSLERHLHKRICKKRID